MPAHLLHTEQPYAVTSEAAAETSLQLLMMEPATDTQTPEWFENTISKGGYAELCLSCAGIPRMDLASKSDPFAVVYAQDDASAPLRRMGVTETVVDSHKASWVKRFAMPNSDTLLLKVSVYDRDSPSDDLDDHDFVGTCEQVSLKAIRESPTKSIVVDLRRPSHNGTFGSVQLALDAVVALQPFASLHLAVATDAKARTRFYFTISKRMLSGDFHPVYRSESLEKEESQFRILSISLPDLAGGQPDRPFRISLFQVCLLSWFCFAT